MSNFEEKLGPSIKELPKVCVRVGNSNFADVELHELSTFVYVLTRLGFMCTIHQIKD